MGVGGDGAGEGGGGAYADDTKGERSRSHVLVDCWYFVMVAGDDGAGEKEDVKGHVHKNIQLAHVPQSPVLGHWLAAGLMSA